MPVVQCRPFASRKWLIYLDSVFPCPRLSHAVFPYFFRTDSARLRPFSIRAGDEARQRNTRLAMLTSKSARARLAPRREPYWVQIGPGSYLGFRAGAGTWIVRHRDHDGRQQYRSLGEFEEFREAKERADRWLAQIAH